MIRSVFFCVFMFFAAAASAQTFEGKVIYKNVYTSKMPGVTGEQVGEMMGKAQVYQISNGNYKSSLDGSMMQWQLYRSEDNKLYMKMATSPAVYWKDGSENPDEVQKAEVNKGVETILGYLCDELVLTCKSGIQRYYYNSKLGIDSKRFEKHKFGNFNEVVSRTKAVPLKVVIEMPQMTIESTATEIVPGKINASEFELPANADLQKSPY